MAGLENNKGIFGAREIEEMLAIPVYERDANHTQVPDVEELKASVTVTVGDYLASLQKAAAAAK